MPFTRGTRYPVLGNGSGGRLNPLFQAISVIGGQIGVEPLLGQGSATFTRSTIAHHRQPNNIQVLVQANEARIQGARRVENALKHSEDFSNVVWENVSGTTKTADTITFDGTTKQYVRQQVIGGVLPVESKVTVSIEMKAVSALVIGIALNDTLAWNTYDTDAQLTLTSDWVRYSFTATPSVAAATTYILIGDIDKTGTAIGSITGTISVRNAQIEPTSGASNTAPSEYIPTTTAAVAKYYTTTNGNSVSSNVVTEANGVSLHPTVSKKGANCLARYATRADSTAYVVGDRVIPIDGSGTAGGNGFCYEPYVAFTSIASAPTFYDDLSESQLSNGLFEADTTTNWTANSGWTHNGTGYIHSSGTNTLVYSETVGKTWVTGEGYLLEIFVSGRTAGNISAAIPNTGGPEIATTGANGLLYGGRTLTGSDSASILVTVTPSTNFDGTIEYIKVTNVSMETTATDKFWLNKGHYKLAGYLGEPAAENLALWNRDFTNAAWVKTNITALKDATGIDGVANSASTLTADAGNGTAFQTVTIASAAFNTAFFVKRKTGTGTIEITDNGGTNYTDITASLSTGEYLRFDINRTQANPVFGFRIVTSGDEIEVDVAHLATGTVPSSPIITTTASVTRAADTSYPRYDLTGNFDETVGTLFLTYIPLHEDDITNQGILDARNGASNFSVLYEQTGGVITSFDASAAANITKTHGNGDTITLGVRWNAATSKYQVFANGIAGTEATFDGAFTIDTAIALLTNHTAPAIISDIRIYKSDLGQNTCEALTEND